MTPGEKPTPSRAAQARQRAAVTGLIIGMGLAILLLVLGALVLLPFVAAGSIASTISPQMTSTVDTLDTAQAAPAATAAAAATQTREASLAEAPPDAEPVLIEAFDTNANGWLDSITHGGIGNGYSSGTFLNKRYVFTVTDDDDGRVWWSLPDNPPSMPRSFTLSVDARQVSGQPDAGYGLVFNLSDTNDRWVIFMVADNKYFTVRSSMRGETSVLARWFPADIHAGGWNHLTIRAEDGHTWFLVNGGVVFETDEVKASAGKFGMVLAPHDVEMHQVEFDDLSLYSLESAP